ncbi:hypothetical protein BCR43DRAFT_513380 [Syncephalastrum racemosum]|uniref:Uncharacterized protein n=1 Tax=Syncephalastrum racemosum TaxID=13706 RepID=A0A1X2HJG7_SYNRA|nr:hypothetical protein BCR43DRAFT_513380 [Syncephalastrum racemosum]
MTLVDQHQMTVQKREDEPQALRAEHEVLQIQSKAAHEEEKGALQEQVTADTQAKIDSAWTQLTVDHAEEKKQQAAEHAQAVPVLEEAKTDLQKQLDVYLAENAKWQTRSETLRAERETRTLDVPETSKEDNTRAMQEQVDAHAAALKEQETVTEALRAKNAKSMQELQSLRPLQSKEEELAKDKEIRGNRGAPNGDARQEQHHDGICHTNTPHQKKLKVLHETQQKMPEIKDRKLEDFSYCLHTVKSARTKDFGAQQQKLAGLEEKLAGWKKKSRARRSRYAMFENEAQGYETKLKARALRLEQLHEENEQLKRETEQIQHENTQMLR